MFRQLLLLIALGASAQAVAARPPKFTPATPDTVIEKLPRGYAQLAPPAAQPAKAAGGARVALPVARRLLAASAATGDARLATRAQALLDGLSPTEADATEALRLRAFSAQHHHDFAGAVALLDRLVARDPRDSDALLSRAQVQIVRGRLDLARADCAALVLGVDAAGGTLCAATLSLRRGKLEIAAMLAERWLQAVPPGDQRRVYALLLRAEAASRAGATDAEGWFRQALALGGDDVRTLAAYARFLRGAGRGAAALQLLARAPATDALGLERALAARAAGSADASSLAKAQARRYAIAHAVGSTPELREEAEYELTLRGDAARALAIARRNWVLQRDFEDASILRRAANAAGQPGVLAQVDAWERGQGIAASGAQP